MPERCVDVSIAVKWFISGHFFYDAVEATLTFAKYLLDYQ